MNGQRNEANVPRQDDLPDALRALAAMTDRSEKAQAKFTPGTSPHTLLRNRLRAFHTAEALMKTELHVG